MERPQEAPRGKDVPLPERFKFNQDETSLAVRAVGDFAISSLRTLESNWPIEDFHAASGSVAALEARVGRTKRFLDNCSGLMEKLSEGENNRHGIELTGDQLEITMNALFHFGVHTSSVAGETAEARIISFNSEQDRQTSVDKITDGGTQAKTLFKKLEPVAIEHKLSRMVWDEQPFAADKK